MGLTPYKFALMGAAGFVAPRHMKAIRDTGNKLVSAFDPSDSVGVLDQYGFDIQFFTDQRQFESTLSGVDFVSIATPNYLHRDHCRVALGEGCNVICEKPLVTDQRSLDFLGEVESKTGKTVYTVLQLRHHPVIVNLRDQVLCNGSTRYSVKLNYVTPRGVWYHRSWKGNENLSGGLVFNIGIHLLDMLLWVFGDVEGAELFHKDAFSVGGMLHLARADVDWFLSVDPDHNKGTEALRTMVVDGTPVDFSTGFSDLHTRVYQEILSGEGFGIKDVAPSISLACAINHMDISPKRHVLLHGNIS